MLRALQGMDRFAHPVQFNVRGRSKIPSTPGLLLTVVCAVLLVIFATDKAKELFQRNAPQVNYTRALDTYSVEDVVDLSSIGFMIAFGVADFWTG